jgi:hypothetical protein
MLFKLTLHTHRIDATIDHAMHCLSSALRTLSGVLATGLFFWCAFLISAGSLVNQFTIPLRIALRVFPAFFA